MKSKRRRPSLPKRITILFLGEGASERSYGTFFGKLSDECGLHFHFDSRISGNPGGGDLLVLVKKAITIIRTEWYRRRNKHAFRFLLLDTDINDPVSEQYIEGISLARENDIHLIWQENDHEGFLLRHFDGYGGHNLSKADTVRQLARFIPNYRKGMVAEDIKKCIDVDNVIYACANIPSLKTFIDIIGWDI